MKGDEAMRFLEYLGIAAVVAVAVPLVAFCGLVSAAFTVMSYAAVTAGCFGCCYFANCWF